MKEDKFKSGEYPAQFLIKHMLKDLNFILETARQTGFAAKLGEPFRNFYAEGLGEGLGE